jgi:hypothetical protein
MKLKDMEIDLRYVAVTDGSIIRKGDHLKNVTSNGIHRLLLKYMKLKVF